MTEKPIADTSAFVRALYEAWDVGKDKTLPVANTHHAKIWMQRCERVISNFWLGGGYGCKESGLSRIGQTDKPEIGDQFQTQPKGPNLCRLAGVGPPWCLIGGGFKTGIAPAAIPALGQ